MPVAEMRRRVSHREWVEWQGYFAILAQREEIRRPK